MVFRLRSYGCVNSKITNTMKKFFALLSSIFVFGLNAQMLTHDVSGIVIGSNAQPVGGAMVIIYDSLPNMAYTVDTLLTNPNGAFSGSYQALSNTGALYVAVYCGGSVYTQILPYSPNSFVPTAIGAVNQVFVTISAGCSGTGSLTHQISGVLTGFNGLPVGGEAVLVHDSIQGMPLVGVTTLVTNAAGEFGGTFVATATSGWLVFSIYCNGALVQYSYPYSPNSFVPGPNGSGVNMVADTLSAPCFGSGTNNCVANFEVDTVNSFNGQVVIWNLSQPAFAGHSLLYDWDFGDGNYSNQAFPNHVYNQVGQYAVCLTITELDSLNNAICSSTFCDSLGMDANGNLIYKGQTTGFTMVVLDPNTISVKETSGTSAVLYPNPANNALAVKGWSDNLEIGIEILNYSGQTVIKSSLNTGSPFGLDALSEGLYFVRLTHPAGKTETHKLLIKR